MTQTKIYPKWDEKVNYSPDGAQPEILMVNDKAKILVAGLEAGQKIPAHPENMAMYHILEGTGWMVIDGEQIPIASGATIVMPDGTSRGMIAETRLAFLAVRIA